MVYFQKILFYDFSKWKVTMLETFERYRKDNEFRKSSLILHRYYRDMLEGRMPSGRNGGMIMSQNLALFLRYLKESDRVQEFVNLDCAYSAKAPIFDEDFSIEEDYYFKTIPSDLPCDFIHRNMDSMGAVGVMIHRGKCTWTENLTEYHLRTMTSEIQESLRYGNRIDSSFVMSDNKFLSSYEDANEKLSLIFSSSQKPFIPDHNEGWLHHLFYHTIMEEMWNMNDDEDERNLDIITEFLSGKTLTIHSTMNSKSRPMKDFVKTYMDRIAKFLNNYMKLKGNYKIKLVENPENHPDYILLGTRYYLYQIAKKLENLPDDISGVLSSEDLEYRQNRLKELHKLLC